jgi:hypothetical protein
MCCEYLYNQMFALMKPFGIRLTLPVLLLVLLSSAKGTHSMDDLPINKIQIIGSHNSYKQAIDPTLFGKIRYVDDALARSLDYSHIGLSDQLSLGLHNLEIDLYADVKGGKYAHPGGLKWIGKSARKLPYDPLNEMNEPGFKIFHVQDIDFRSNCLTLTRCLRELKDWSDEHKDHYPVFITINAKDDIIPLPGFTLPEKFRSPVFDRLDKAIVGTLGADKIITPDDVRGGYPTLESAVLAGHWPTMAEARGKFIFILDEIGKKRSTYISGHPSLHNRVIFVNADPGTPEAAFLIINDPLKDSGKIRDMVRKGYMVRTRADADTEEARRNDLRRFNAACASGAQIITTDYYRKSTHFSSDYVVSFDKGEYMRENPY